MMIHHDNEQCAEKLISLADPLLYPWPHERYLDLGTLVMEVFSKCALTMLIYIYTFASLRMLE